MALESSGGRVRRSEGEKENVVALLKQGKTIKEVMEEMYGGYKTGCSDYNFVVNTRNDLKKAGFLGVDAPKISSKKSPKKDTRNISVDAERDAALQELLDKADDAIAKCEKRLKELNRQKELLLSLR